MGTSTSKVFYTDETKPLHKHQLNQTPQETSNSSAKDFKFQHFTERCLQLQGQKQDLESQIRMELEKWRGKHCKDASRDECRQNIIGLLSELKTSQLTQEEMITKEKIRLDAFRNLVNEDTTERLKVRLNFFSLLNKEHDKLLYLFREDSRECKAICKKHSDVQLRKRTGSKFESWLRCPPCTSYDYGSVGSI
ncbi:uncharacterized protein LOC124439004 isoform X2 [Xenia sp. Carnegie-2017]|uniref:uncharacterized protein LOC124439004 isoform X2 n=1 Tax=Xenia sp. Carnegie-2017 TaxID=2897299 RepID=UPI001F0488C0|nr:uncharacterized protein LOC124439004 isoform X2 [Xenia sp. Carnegie-2017]